jgi:hypothetical protein
MRDLYPKHGRRWTWRHPTRWVCRCGLDGYPCAVTRMLEREEAEIRAAFDAHEDGLAAAREWQHEERRRRTDGLR